MSTAMERIAKMLDGREPTEVIRVLQSVIAGLNQVADHILIAQLEYDIRDVHSYIRLSELRESWQLETQTQEKTR